MTEQIKVKHFSETGCQVSYRDDESLEKPQYVKKCPASTPLALGYLIQEYFKLPITISGMSLEEFDAEIQAHIEKK